MNEWRLVWMVPFKLFPTVFFILAYVIGGRSDKWVRRFVGSFVFIGWCVTLSAYAGTLSLKSFCLGSIAIGLMFGYGGNTFWTKFARRLFYGLMLGASGLLIGILYERWVYGVFQCVMAVQASLVLGLSSGDDAVDEEALIALFSVAVIPFMIA